MVPPFALIVPPTVPPVYRAIPEVPSAVIPPPAAVIVPSNDAAPTAPFPVTVTVLLFITLALAPPVTNPFTEFAVIVIVPLFVAVPSVP